MLKKSLINDSSETGWLCVRKGSSVSTSYPVHKSSVSASLTKHKSVNAEILEKNLGDTFQLTDS